MKFLSDILAKAGLTVDGVVTLNNTATGQTPNANDNSTKLATTAWVRTFVQPYNLPIASSSILGGVKVGSGLSIDSGTGVLSVTGAGSASIKSTQTFIATASQTVFTITGGYTPGLIDVFLNGVYLSPNQTTATNGTTVVLDEAAAAGDIIDVIVASPIYQGSTITTDQLPEGIVNLYYTDTRARASISLTTTGVSGAATYNSSTGVFNIPNYQGLVPAGGVAGDILAKVSGTNYDVTWIPNYTSQVQHIVKAGVALTKGQAVYVSSADGTNMIVSKASNASEATSSKTLGLVAQDLAINGQGFIVTEGLLAGLNTSTANAGDPVWLGTDGNLIFGLLNKPTAPAHLVFIGVVTRVQSNNGEIFVKVQNGFELDELHDLSVKNASDGDMIKYVASTGLWTKIAATTTNITEGTNLYYTDTRARAAITLTTTGTSGAATYSGGVLNIPQYQAVLTNPVTGTGTQNTLPKFTDASTIGNSSITDNLTFIGMLNGRQGLTLGADNNGVVISENTVKRGRINVPQYGNPNSTPVGIISGAIESASNTIIIGGTQGGYALAADTITFQIGATYNATSGTEIARFASNGSLGIGTTSLTGYTLRVSKNITGATVGYGVTSDGQVQTDVTSTARYYQSISNLAASVSVGGVHHFRASQGTFGSGAAITTAQVGFFADAGLVGGANNYGFQGSIPSGANRWNIYMDGTANNYMAGSLGIGTTSIGAASLTVAKTLTGATSRYGIYQAGQVQSDVTTLAIGIYNQLNTAGSAFTLGSYVHLLMQQGTIGATSAITEQFGVFIDSTLTGATNNYGIYSSLAAGTGRWNLYFAGTASSYIAGNLGIGSTSLTSTSFRVSKSITGSTISYGIANDGVVQSGVSSSAIYYQTNAQTAAASFTVNNIYHNFASQGTFGAGSTVNNQYGFFVDASLIGATNDYGFYGNIAEGTGRWNLYMNGTANNFLNGKLGIGTTSITEFNLRINRNIVGSTTSYGISSEGTIQSTVTVGAAYYSTSAATAATTFTLANLYHYVANQGTLGAGSTVTNQYGFFANTQTNATNNYGFYGNIASGTNRWNLYMNGSASNFMLGNTGIGILPSYKLDVQTNNIAGIQDVAQFSVIGNGAAGRGVGILIGSGGSGSTVQVARLVGYQETTSATANNASFSIQVANSSGTLTEYLRINNLGGVGIGVSTINASAKVQIDSTTQGFLPPRMTSAQRTAISSAATGLIVYQTDGVEGLWLNTSTGWKTLTVV